MWLLAVAAVAALGLFSAYQRRRAKEAEQAQAAGDSEEGPHDDVATLKRLLREVFADLVAVRARLDELESEAGITSNYADSPEASYLGSSTARGKRRAGGGAKQAAVSGVWRLGGGLLWAQEDEPSSSAHRSPAVATPGTGGGAAGGGTFGEALPAAGVRLGTDLLVRLSRAVRGGADSLHGEAALDLQGQRVAVRRVLYRASVRPGLRLLLAPFGGRGEDAAYTLNPLAGQGLSALVRRGCPLHSAQLGSLAGAVVDGQRAWGSAALFTRSAAGGKLASSVLAQGVIAPRSMLSLGLTYLQHNEPVAEVGSAPNTPLPSPGGQRPLLWGALRGASAPPVAEVGGSPAVGMRGPAVAALQGAPSRQLGALLAAKVDPDLVLHGWAVADASGAARSLRRGALLAAARPAEWGLVLGSMPDGTGNGWAIGAGRARCLSGEGSGGGGGGLLPNMVELSMQYNMGDGLLVSPGMLLLRRAGRVAAFVGVKCEFHL